MDREQFQKSYGKIVAKAWTDEEFKRRLLSDGTTVLKESGLALPDEVEFKVVESTSSLIHLILPPKPDSEEVTAADLETRAAAFVGYSCGMCGAN